MYISCDYGTDANISEVGKVAIVTMAGDRNGFPDSLDLDWMVAPCMQLEKASMQGLNDVAGSAFSLDFKGILLSIGRQKCIGAAQYSLLCTILIY